MQRLGAQAAGWKCAARFSFAVVAEDDDRTPLGHRGMKIVAAGVAEVGYWTAAQASLPGLWKSRRSGHCARRTSSG